MAFANADFSRAVEKFASGVPEVADMAIRKISIEMMSSIILSTPVDTGHARGNWQASVSVPAGGTLEVEDKSGAVAIAKMTTTAATWQPSKQGVSLFLTNNLPYIERLEDGWSKKQGGHMVKMAMANVQAFVKRALS
jgi:hypothetical protein